jgi:uncharacterized protein (TIGR03000 family)
MYGVALATVLAGGFSAPAWDDGDGTRRSLEELKRSVEKLRKEQHEQQVEGLEQTIKQLRSEKTDEKIDEVRRAVEERRREHRGAHHGPRFRMEGPWRFWMERGPSRFRMRGGPPRRPMPRAAAAPRHRAVVRVSLPANATLFANDREVPLAARQTTFVTPELEPGQPYYYDFRVRVKRDGQTMTRTKRVPVRPGSVVRLSYDEMTPAGGS